MRIFKLRLPAVCALGAVLLALASAPRAVAQDFSITATDFSPSPVDQGAAAAATLTLQPLNGFNGPVNLSCTVSPQVSNGPTCLLSQTSVTPPAQPSISLITNATTPAELYTVTVTASSANTTIQVPLTDTVVVVIPDYTITINTAISPTSLHAGSGATVILDINPVSYSGTVTPVCTTITPAVVYSPICTFNPPQVTVSGAAPSTVTLTISTTGPNTTTTTSVRKPYRALYALWLMPGFVFCGFALRRPGSKTNLSRFLGLTTLIASVLLLPSCNTFGGNSTAAQTPNNTYSVVISGVDQNSVGPSNSSVSVTLTVD